MASEAADGDVVGDDIVAEALDGADVGEVTSSKKVKRPSGAQKKQARKKKQADKAVVCHGCKVEIKDDEERRTFSRLTWHPTCASNEKCMQFIASESPKLKAAVTHLKKTNPTRYAAMARTLTTENGEKRSPEQRQAVMKFIVEFSTESRAGRRSQTLMLPKVPFCVWYEHHYKYTPKQAEQYWDDLMKDPLAPKELEDGTHHNGRT